MDGLFYVGLVALLIIVGAVLGSVAFRRSSGLRDELTGMRRELAMLRQAVATLQAALPVAETPSAPASQHVPAPATPVPETRETAASDEIPVATPNLAAAMAPQATAPAGDGLERSLTGRWTVWLGALALALSGVFLVKYSIEQDLLGPAVRVGLGLLLGLALIGGGLWLRLSPGDAGVRSETDSVPPALAAAGVAALFATVYAAFALYFFLPSLLAFALMAAIATAAVMLSLLFGPFIACLGLAGAFLVPLLVPSDAPSAWSLFGYLLIVAIGCLALVRYKGWWWLGHAALAGSTIWAVVWLGLSWHHGDELAIGSYIVLLTGAVIGFTRDVPATTEPDRLVWVAASFAALATLWLTVVAVNSATSIVTSFALILLLVAIGRRYPTLERLPWLSAGMAVAIVASWGLDDGILYRALDQMARFGHPPFVAEQVSAFVWTTLLFALLFGGGGYIAQWGAQRPGRWAAMAASTAVALLCVAYWRLAEFAPATPWTMLGLALAAVNLAAAWQTARYRDQLGMEAALAAYAIGVLAATTFAATMSLHLAWLSLALAVQLPAIAWVAEETSVVILRRVALAFATAALVRLLLNREIIDYPIGGLILNWLLYGYGIPCAAFFLAARLFRRTADDLLVAVLEAGGIALGLALISLEIHQLLGDGTLAHRRYDILEGGLQVNAWLAVATALLYRSRVEARPVLVWGWRIVGGAALAHFVIFQLLLGNPLLTGDPVGTQPIVNIILLAYGMPAVLAALFHREATRQDERIAAAIAAIVTLVSGFLALSLELRQWFHGSDLRAGKTSDAEAYSYSLAWLAYGGVLLGFGIASRDTALRLAGLVVMTLTVAKAFLFDMSNLTGLYRVGSFLALGLCLIGIGYLYQRVVFPPRAASASDAT